MSYKSPGKRLPGLFILIPFPSHQRRLVGNQKWVSVLSMFRQERLVNRSQLLLPGSGWHDYSEKSTQNLYIEYISIRFI